MQSVTLDFSPHPHPPSSFPRHAQLTLWKVESDGGAAPIPSLSLSGFLGQNQTFSPHVE